MYITLFKTFRTDSLPSLKTEDSYHGLWDSIIKNTLEIFGMHNTSLPALEFDRNTSKRTSTGKLSSSD